jgi:hypothetical protein
MVVQLMGDGGSFDPIGATYPPLVLPRGDSWTTFISRTVLEDRLGRPPRVRAYVFIAGQQTAVRSKPTLLWGRERESTWASITAARVKVRAHARVRTLTFSLRPPEDPAALAIRIARRTPAVTRGPGIRGYCEAVLDEIFDRRGLIYDPVAPLASTPSVSFGVVEVSLHEISFGSDPQIAFAIVGCEEPSDSPLEEAEWLALVEKLRWRVLERTLVITQRLPRFALDIVPGTQGRLMVRDEAASSEHRAARDYVLVWQGVGDSERRMLRWIYDTVYSTESMALRDAYGDWS